MSGVASVRVWVVGGGVAALVAGCAAPPPASVSCNDLSGTYLNAPEAELPAPSLAEVLLQTDVSVRTVTLASTADGTSLAVTADTTRRVLQSGVDFTCTSAGAALHPVLTTDMNVLDLGTARELTEYVLEKRGDGSLVAHRTATRSATAFGIPFKGKALPEDDLVWRPAR